MAPFRSATGNVHPANGIAYPNDMTVLKQVFDQVCREYCISAEDADDLARVTMSLFNAGMTDEVKLRESLIEYLARRVGRAPPASFGSEQSINS